MCVRILAMTIGSVMSDGGPRILPVACHRSLGRWLDHARRHALAVVPMSGVQSVFLLQARCMGIGRQYAMIANQVVVSNGHTLNSIQEDMNN